LFRAARVSPGDANGHCELVRAVSFAGPSRAFVTGGWDGCVRRWAWSRDGRRVYSAGPLAAHADRVEFVDAVKQGDGVIDSRRAGLVVTGGRDCSLRVYDIEAASPAPLRKTYTYESVSAGCVNTNGVDVFVGARSGAASVFDVETGQKKLVFSSEKAPAPRTT
jgi:WD40 repeat protein